MPEVCLKNQLDSSQIVTLGQQYPARGNNSLKGSIYSTYYSSVVFKLSYIYANMIITRYMQGIGSGTIFYLIGFGS